MSQGARSCDELDATPEKRARKVSKERRKRVVKSSLESPEKQEPKRARPLRFAPAADPPVEKDGGITGGAAICRTGPGPEDDGRRGAAEGSDRDDPGQGQCAEEGYGTGGVDVGSDQGGEFFDPKDAAVSGGDASFLTRAGASKPNQEDRRHAEEENWGAVRTALLKTFVETSKARRTARQERSDSLKSFVQEAAGSPPSTCNYCKGTAPTTSFAESARQSVLFISQATRFPLSVPVFSCSSCTRRSHAHPLSVHAFPDTAVWGLRLWEVRGNQGQPTWFDLDLLEFYDSLTFNGKRGAMSLESFCAAIELVHLENGCVEPALSSDGFRKGFGKAWEELGYILHSARDPHAFGVENFEPSPFASCAACQSANVQKPLHSVYLDACFKMKHIAIAGVASRFRQPFINDCSLLPDGAVKGFLDLPESAAPAGESTCSEFKADSVYGASKQSIYDIAGYMGVFCRHGVLGLGANVFHGERYGYATLLLLTLLAVWKVPVQFCWYDIGCRYKVHLGAWLALQTAAVFQIQGSALPFQTVMALAAAMAIVVPPFHQYAHSSSCQAENSGKHARGAGRAVGEPPENAWSFFGTFNRQLQHRSVAGRADFLARLRGCWNEQKARGLPELLVRIHIKSRLQIATSSEDLTRLKEEAREAGVNLNEAADAARASSPDQVQPGDAWSVEYARLLLQHDKLVAETGTNLPSLDVIFAAEGSAFQKLRSSSDFSKRVKKRLAEMEARYKDQIGVDSTGKVQRWKVGDQAFSQAFVLLRQVEMQRLQREIESTVHELLYAHYCASRLGDRPGDLKKLRKEIERTRARVRQSFDCLKRWGLEFTAATDGEDASASRSSTPGLSQERSGQELSGWRVEDILRGNFPWLEEGSSWTQSVSQGLRFKHRLALLLDERTRGEEEKSLVEREMACTLARYEQQVESLESRMRALNGDGERLGSGNAINYVLGVVDILDGRLRLVQSLNVKARSLFERALKEHISLTDWKCIFEGERRLRKSITADDSETELTDDEDDM